MKRTLLPLRDITCCRYIRQLHKAFAMPPYADRRCYTENAPLLLLLRALMIMTFITYHTPPRRPLRDATILRHAARIFHATLPRLITLDFRHAVAKTHEGEYSRHSEGEHCCYDDDAR